MQPMQTLIAAAGWTSFSGVFSTVFPAGRADRPAHLVRGGEPEAPLSRRFAALALALAALGGVLIGVVAHQLGGAGSDSRGSRAARVRGAAVWPAGLREAPEFALPDQAGRRLALASLRGRPVILAFMDSQCHQECPLEGRALATAFRMVRRRRAPSRRRGQRQPLGRHAGLGAPRDQALRPGGFRMALAARLTGEAGAGLAQVRDRSAAHEGRHRTHRRDLPDRCERLRAGRHGLPVLAQLGRQRPRSPGGRRKLVLTPRAP